MKGNKMALIIPISCKSNIKEVRSNKEEETGVSGPLGLASLSGTSSPAPLPTANDCQAIRNEILQSRPTITRSQLSYMRLSMLHPKSADNDGDRYTRLAFNMDMSVNSNTEFLKLKWRLTDKRSEYYANLPAEWERDPALNSAWELYNDLDAAWIGKACYRKTTRTGGMKLKMVPLTSMVVWMQADVMHYHLWVEDAEVQGRITWNEMKHYAGYSEPIRNMQPASYKILAV
jgi:hypothetical protein